MEAGHPNAEEAEDLEQIAPSGSVNGSGRAWWKMPLIMLGCALMITVVTHHFVVIVPPPLPSTVSINGSAVRFSRTLDGVPEARNHGHQNIASKERSVSIALCRYRRLRSTVLLEASASCMPSTASHRCLCEPSWIDLTSSYSDGLYESNSPRKTR